MRSLHSTTAKTGLLEKKDYLAILFAVPQAALPAVHLARFAAEDEGRTEEPTDRRLREERDKGRVPKSQDLTNAIILIGAVMALYFTGGYMVGQCMQLFKTLLGEGVNFSEFHEEEVKHFTAMIFVEVFKIGIPLFAISMLMGIIANVVQVGGMFTVRPLFMPERLIPDFKRILPGRRNFYSLLKTCLLYTSRFAR